jgi:hypothetical protein
LNNISPDHSPSTQPQTTPQNIDSTTISSNAGK